MIGLYKDPAGENIFKKSNPTNSGQLVNMKSNSDGINDEDMDSWRNRVADLENELEKMKVIIIR